MLVLEVEGLGTIDLNFLYCFDNIPKKITNKFLTCGGSIPPI